MEVEVGDEGEEYVDAEATDEYMDAEDEEPYRRDIAMWVDEVLAATAMSGGASIPPDVPEAGPAEPAEPAEASVRHNDWPERDVVGGVDDDEAYDTLWHQGGQSSHDRQQSKNDSSSDDRDGAKIILNMGAKAKAAALPLTRKLPAQPPSLRVTLAPEKPSLKLSLKAAARHVAASDEVDFSDDAAGLNSAAASASSGPRWKEPPPESDDEVGQDDPTDATWDPRHAHEPAPPPDRRKRPHGGHTPNTGRTPPSKLRRTDTALDSASRGHRPVSTGNGARPPRPTAKRPTSAGKGLPRSSQKSGTKATTKQRLIKMLKKPGKLSR